MLPEPILVDDTTVSSQSDFRLLRYLTGSSPIAFVMVRCCLANCQYDGFFDLSFGALAEYRSA
jgi:hypothetical protein